MPLLYLHGSLCRESVVSIVMDTYFLTVKSHLRLLGTPSPLLCVNSPCKTKVRRGGDGCGLYHAIKMLIQFITALLQHDLQVWIFRSFHKRKFCGSEGTDTKHLV